MNNRRNNVNEHNHHHHRGHSFNGFANIHHFSITNSSHVSGKLGRLSFESAKLVTSGIDDLLSSTEGGKHDYDWLLTPPETPNLPSSEGESQPTSVPQRSSLGRSISNTNVSRLSVSQSESNNHTHSRPARSSSVTRSSNRSSSILNTSPASVSSHTRPSSPITRSPSAVRPSTPTSRSTASRPSTPSRVARSLPTNSYADTNKTRTSQGSRPSTPTSTSRPHFPANLHSPSTTTRSLSRPSTPTRRHSMPSPSSPAPRVGRNSAPSSPGPRPQPIVPPDFPLETPPNLRTTLPDRPISAGRSRPGAVVTLKPNSETQAPVTIPRRQSSPIVHRGRFSEYTAKSRANAADGRVPHATELVSRKSVKSSATVPDNNGLGRTISKKSLDMAVRHMDIRNSSGTLGSLPSATLFPQSIRTSTPKTHHTRGLSAPASVNIKGSMQSRNNEACFDLGNSIKRINGREIDERQYFTKFKEVDVYDSSCYDSLLLREDLNNTNWLHSVDDKCDQGPIFDNGFESLPEPFGLW